MSGLTNNRILTTLQKDVLQTLFSDEWFSKTFYLTGGTALSAFYLEHRESDDLDFFTSEPLHEHLLESVRSLLQSKGHSIEAERRAPTFMRCRVNDSLILDFATDQAARFGVPKCIQGVIVDSEENIAVNKVVTILGRLDPKDYVDLYFLLRERDYKIADLLSKGEQKDAGMEPFIWSQLIADCETFTILPRMRKALSLDELKAFFRMLRADVVKQLRPV